MINNESQDSKLDRLFRKAKKKNLAMAEFDSEVFAKFNNQRRNQRIGEQISRSSGAVREIGMIPLSVYNMLPDDVKNDNKKLAHWLETDELGKNFKTIEKF